MRYVVIAFSAVCTVALLALAGATGARADVVGSAHDLIANPNANTEIVRTGGDLTTNGVCIFCHTPHNSATGAAALAPLWNRAASVATGWTMYSGSVQATIPGTPAAESMACLSCHDGATAIDALLYNPDAIAVTVNAVANGAIGDLSATGADMGGLGGTPGTADLSNDHPISIEYGLDTDGAMATIAAVQAADLAGTVKLFGSGNDQVECASCHNPHDTTNNKFLRSTNTNSALCILCHADK
jgi:predicted CXXCH cytochrome family protein